MGDIISIQDYKNKKANKEREEELKIAEQEYNEFIKLLKYFVDIQEHKYEEIHITPQVDGTYKMIDESGFEVYREFYDLEEEIRSSNSEVSYDDLLISSLITMSPKKIIINNSDSIKNKELLETINKVFENTELRKCL